MKKYLKYISLMLICILISTLCNAQKSKEKAKSSRYDYEGPLVEGRSKVKKEQKWGFIDRNGGIVVGIKYNQVENFSEGLAKVRINQRWGLVDSTGKVIIQPAFDWIYDFQDGIAKVKINGQEYFMDKNGQRVK